MNSGKGKLEKNIGEDGEFIRILWCDNANIIRGKALYVNKENISQKMPLKVGISSGQQGVPVMYDQVIESSLLTPVGEIELEADLQTLTPLPYAPGNFRAMGDMNLNGKNWEYCPRGFLKRMIAKLFKLGISIKASFENEFYLLDLEESKDILPREKTPFASTYSLDLNQEFIRDVVYALHKQDIMVEQYYSESGPGQQEITIKFQEALGAADNQIAFRETVKAIALQKGMIASFLPKLFPQESGSGCHLHLSLWKNDKNISGSSDDAYGLSTEGKYFIAGVLHHLPALMGISTPTTNSYHRIKPHTWSGAFRCWGIDNREAAIRVISEKDNFVKHFEIKTVDASSNPYLALGAVIFAGYDGIKNKMTLPEPVQQDPGTLSSDERSIKGIRTLPTHLDQALTYLEKDRDLMDALGSKLSQAYLAVKKAEFEYFKDLSHQEEVEILLDKF